MLLELCLCDARLNKKNFIIQVIMKIKNSSQNYNVTRIMSVRCTA